MRMLLAALLSSSSAIPFTLMPSTASAGSPSAALSSIGVGTPIRLELTGVTLVEGSFLGLHGDSLILRVDAGPTAWSLSSVTAVWQRRMSRRRGALIVGTIGAVALSIAAYNGAKSPGCWFECSWPPAEPSTLYLATSTAVGAVVGFAVGAGVGAIAVPRSESWIQTFPQRRSPWSFDE